MTTDPILQRIESIAQQESRQPPGEAPAGTAPELASELAACWDVAQQHARHVPDLEGEAVRDTAA